MDIGQGIDFQWYVKPKRYRVGDPVGLGHRFAISSHLTMVRDGLICELQSIIHRHLAL